MPYPRSPATEKTNITANKSCRVRHFHFHSHTRLLLWFRLCLFFHLFRSVYSLLCFLWKKDGHTCPPSPCYFLVSFFNYRFYEFKFSQRFFTVIINPVPERINSINSHTLGVLSPVLGAVTSFLSVPLDGLSSEELLLLYHSGCYYRYQRYLLWW